jgi:hypothetical protein
MMWRVAKSLGPTGTEGLLGEINARAPDRSKQSDGAIGDTRHSVRRSDHNPCECCGVVCARDFTHDPPHFDSHEFAEWLRHRVLEDKEPRVKYVISAGCIFSGHGQPYAAGQWRAYHGSNRHDHHVHVSVRHGPALYDDDTPWGWALGGGGVTPRPRV